MGWTNERTVLLKKLWQDGLSASQIARQLGGATRNAVIGKVHRLGLSGRASVRLRKRVSQRPRREMATLRRTRPAPTPPTPAAPALRPVRPTFVEAPGLATITTLGAHACKWPIGDPLSDGFRLCGRNAGRGPYCLDHAGVAFRAADPGQRTASELARSLRRYL
jgi:GcrA cell cycle regulator